MNIIYIYKFQLVIQKLYQIITKLITNLITKKISSKISDFSSATGQDTNVAKINSFGWKTGDAKSGKL